MKRKISCTVTVGKPSERHDHDVDYRNTLEHVHSDLGEIIELIPHVDYQTQINEMMRPYIDEYNERRARAYQNAMEQYRRGEIKRKPRARDYAPMNYDYYTDHADDHYYNRRQQRMETIPRYRGIILGLGDRADRQQEVITRQEAMTVFTAVVEQWNTLFPTLKLLGAVIHLDEEGFYHIHITYYPLFERPDFNEHSKGLRVSRSHEGALKYMGYQPEQSIINSKNKPPILFNAFRNQIYRLVERELKALGIRLEYGVSRRKEPQKDSSVNQPLNEWQAIQDGALEAQRLKNRLMDIVEDEATPDYIQDAVRVNLHMCQLVSETKTQNKLFINKNNVMVSISLLNQMRTLFEEAQVSLVALINRCEDLEKQCNDKDAVIIDQDRLLLEKSRVIEGVAEENLTAQHKVSHLFRQFWADLFQKYYEINGEQMPRSEEECRVQQAMVKSECEAISQDVSEIAKHFSENERENAPIEQTTGLLGDANRLVASNDVFVNDATGSFENGKTRKRNTTNRESVERIVDSILGKLSKIFLALYRFGTITAFFINRIRVLETEIKESIRLSGVEDPLKALEYQIEKAAEREERERRKAERETERLMYAMLEWEERKERGEIRW